MANGNEQSNVVAVRGEVPVCIRVCEPICAQSEYKVEITVFGNPVATIAVSGLTRLFNCRDKQ